MDIWMGEERPQPFRSGVNANVDTGSGRPMAVPANANAGGAGAKPFVGVHFKCCGIYCRIYRNKKQDAYEGACPKCRKKIKLPIGSGGTSNRFFEAS